LPKPDDDGEHWFWKFLMLPGPPWEASRNPLYVRGMAVVAATVLAVYALVMILVKLLAK